MRDDRVRRSLQDDSPGVGSFGGDEQVANLGIDVDRRVVQE